MKLTHFDRTLIHGLGLMSRPPLIEDRAEDRMLAEIIGKAAERATDCEDLRHLLVAARRVTDTRGPQRYIAHHIATAMNDFDRRCMAAHWDAARGN